MAHTFMQKVRNAASKVGTLAGAAHAVYQGGKLIFGIGRAVAPYAAALL